MPLQQPEALAIKQAAVISETIPVYEESPHYTQVRLWAVISVVRAHVLAWKARFQGPMGSLGEGADIKYRCSLWLSWV